MLSKSSSRLLDSFALRLTCWYGIFFLLSLSAVFFISYQVLLADFTHIADRQLLATTMQIENESSKEGLDKVITDIRENIEEEGKNRIFYRLLSSDMRVLATSDPLRWPCLNFPQMGQWAAAASAGMSYHSLSPADRPYKVRIISRAITGGRYIVQVGKTMQDEAQLIGVYRKVFAGAVLVLFACGLGLSWMEAQKAMRRIEELMRALKDVTDNIAHDLRTPITRIRGVAETALKNEAAGQIIEECDRLGGMINIMLEIAQAEAGLKKIERKPVDMALVVAQGCEIFEPLAQDKGLQWHWQRPSGPVPVLGGILPLQRIIANLLDNAIKFTPSNGTIEISVEKQGNQARICVKDSGIGIAVDQQERIFEKFYRIESSRSLPGNGLGLSYVRSLASSMGGQISIESAPNQGSCFILTFPLASL